MSASSAAWSFSACDTSGPCVQGAQWRTGVRAQGQDKQLVDGGLRSLALLSSGASVRELQQLGQAALSVGSSASGTLTRHAVTMIVECPKASSLHLGLRPLGDEISPLRSSVCKATLHETVEQSRVTRCDAPRLGEPCQGLPAPGTVVGLLTRTQMHFALKLQTSLSQGSAFLTSATVGRVLFVGRSSCPFLRARLLAAFSLSAALLSRSFRTACQLPIAHMTVQLRNECTCSSSFSFCRSTASEAFFFDQVNSLCCFFQAFSACIHRSCCKT